MNMSTSRPRHRAATFLVVGCPTVVLGATGCGGEGNCYNPPDANARLGPVLIRYAHIAELPDGPREKGDDAPLYTWFFNQGQDTDRLLGAETTVARSVDIVDANGAVRGPVELPSGKLVTLDKGHAHLLLRDLSQQIRGGDHVWITLRFERAGEIALQVRSQIPTYVDGDATDAPGLTSPLTGMTTALERWAQGSGKRATAHAAKQVLDHCSFPGRRVDQGPRARTAPRTRKPNR
ncbi:copper chaperone PCu(A)C [Streptomyces sp. NPDC096048]|uniref:copper chaperone PCu(A)C n=1 Tax=Streptomyces sp. NPDC096048 TaxID=3366072 RepID=UPI003818A6A9